MGDVIEYVKEIDANVANEFNHGEPRKPFTETLIFKAFVFTALPPVAAGVIAAGAPIARYYPHASGPGTYYAQAVGDRADPYHSDPGGEWVRIEAPDNGGTASTFHLILTLGG